MKAIEGIELKDLLANVRAEQREELRKKIQTKIMHIEGKRSEAAGSVAKLEKDLDKAKAALKREQDKLTKIEAGDWNALEDDKDKNQQQQGQQAAE